MEMLKNAISSVTRFGHEGSKEGFVAPELVKGIWDFDLNWRQVYETILECETGWAADKELVHLSGKDVPKEVQGSLDPILGLLVSWKMKKKLPKDFVQEIIGDMLDLNRSLWHKQRRENFNLQQKKVLQFAEWWKLYDFTVANKKLKIIV